MRCDENPRGPSGTTLPRHLSIAQTRITSVGGVDVVQTTLGRHEFPRHLHEAFTIGLVDSGSFDFVSNGRRHVCPAGSLILIDQGDVHTGRAAKAAAGVRYRAMYPTAAVIEPILGMTPSLPTGAGSDPGSIRRLRRLFGRGPSVEDEGMLVELIGGLFDRFRAVGRLTRPARRDLVAAITRYLRDHLTGKPTLAAIAPELGYHPGYLARVFRADTGLPPYAFLVRLRVEHARQLLARGRGAAEAAIQSGFVDQSHLTRHFRRVFGLPPWRYQQQLGRSFRTR